LTREHEVAGFRDEGVEEALVLARLGMPQDADREALLGILEALERPVLRPGRLDEPVADAPDALMVARLDGGLAGADKPREPGALLDLDRMLGEDTLHLAVPAVAEGLRQVLDEVTAAGDVEQLEAAADREHRQVAIERGAEERELARVPSLLRWVGLGMRLGPVLRRGDVGAAGGDGAVEHVERLLHPVLTPPPP